MFITKQDRRSDIMLARPREVKISARRNVDFPSISVQDGIELLRSFLFTQSMIKKLICGPLAVYSLKCYYSSRRIIRTKTSILKTA